MKLIICGSMQFSREMLELKRRLSELSHEVTLPEFAEEYAKMDSIEDKLRESSANKIQHDLIRGYFKKIALGDAILVANYTKNGIENYIGGNAFLEMGFAHVLNKGIYLLNPAPKINYKDEILAMNPIIVGNNLKNIPLTTQHLK